MARALQIVVNVADVNDNPPVCPSEITTFEVQENEGAGTFSKFLINCSSFRIFSLIEPTYQNTCQFSGI